MSKKTGNKKPSPLIKGVLDITISGMGYLIADGNIMSEMSPQNNDRLDGMFFLIPQIMGRDLMDLAVYNQNPAWLYLGSSLYRPLSGLTHVAADQSAVPIGNDGFAEWRTLPASGSIV